MGPAEGWVWGLLLTQPWCSGRDFASLPSEPHVWSSAGVSDRSQKPQQHRSEVHWLWGFYAVIVELISCVRDKVVELGCTHLCEHSLWLLTTEKRWTCFWTLVYRRKLAEYQAHTNKILAWRHISVQMQLPHSQQKHCFTLWSVGVHCKGGRDTMWMDVGDHECRIILNLWLIITSVLFLSMIGLTLFYSVKK